MSNAKHTPGPWEAEDRIERILIWQQPSKQYRSPADHEAVEVAVLTLDDRDDAAGEDTLAANAALIAAAPDLLAAAQMAQENLDASMRGARPPHNDLKVATALRAALGVVPGLLQLLPQARQPPRREAVAQNEPQRLAHVAGGAFLRERNQRLVEVRLEIHTDGREFSPGHPQNLAKFPGAATK